MAKSETILRDRILLATQIEDYLMMSYSLSRADGIPPELVLPADMSVLAQQMTIAESAEVTNYLSQLGYDPKEVHPKVIDTLKKIAALT